MAIRAAIREGGVINEHHGVGLKLGRLMRDLYGPAFGRALKPSSAPVDPNNIMNPGKLGFQGSLTMPHRGIHRDHKSLPLLLHVPASLAGRQT